MCLWVFAGAAAFAETPVDGETMFVNFLLDMPWEDASPELLKQVQVKVKKFCISLLESAGSFAYTRGVMGELDTSIRSWFISSLFPLFTMPVLLP